MYKRTLADDVIRNMDLYPAVAILGPRQIGKTTLALEIAKSGPSVYLDLESPEDLQKLADPAHYLGLHADSLVILDEVQRRPDLFMSLRGVIDARRREGRGNGRFLILGSASNKPLRQSSESLAGRISYRELSGLGPFEIEAPHGDPLRKLWTRGGFPDSFSAPSDHASHAWRRNLVRTYVERDIPQMGPRIPAETLFRFWTMLAHLQGELFNASKLARSLGCASVTINRYVDLMVDLLLVRRLEPWSGNVQKRLVRSPRIYVRDSGIVHALLNIADHEGLMGHPVLGKSWEGFVIEKVITAAASDVLPFFYRTSAGAEIDLLLEFGPDDRWAVDIKAGRAPTPTRGFHLACEDLKIKRKFLIYGGEDRFAAGNQTTVLSLSRFIESLNERLGRSSMGACG